MRYGLFLLGLTAAAAWLPGAIDAPMSLRWAAIAALSPICLLLVPVRDVAPFPWAAAGIVALMAVSLAWAPDALGGIDALMQVAVLIATFWLGASLRDAKPLWFGFIAGMAMSAVLALAQVLGFDGVPQAAPPGGLFSNRNIMAEALAIACIAAFCYRAWAVLALMLIAFSLAGSKGAFIGLGAAAAVWMLPRRPAYSALIVAIGAALLTYLIAAGHPSVMARADIWLPVMQTLTPEGHGIGSFAAVFPMHEYAHSEPLQLLYEFGVLTPLFFAFALYVAQGWSGETELESMAFAAIAVMSLFSFPLHMPATAFAAALAAGRLVGARHRVVERHSYSRAALAGGAG